LAREELLERVLRRGLSAMAADLAALAAIVEYRRSDRLALVSLARAGTPVGVALTRIFRERYRREVCHYSISYVPSLGLDRAALARVLESHLPEEIVFVDAWIGDEARARGFTQAVLAFNRETGVRLNPKLAVLSNPLGAPALTPGARDYLMPPVLFGAYASGLIGPIGAPAESGGPRAFHECHYFPSLAGHDLTLWLMDKIMWFWRTTHNRRRIPRNFFHLQERRAQRARAARIWRDFSRSALAKYGVADRRLILPGVCETARALLEGSVALALVRDLKDPELERPLQLAESRGAPIRLVRHLPYKAVAIARAVRD
jgi:hypothetical protein